MKTKLQTIDEALANIRLNGRCLRNGQCAYYHDGNSCAVGMFLEDECRTERFASDNMENDSDELFMYLGFDILKPEYRIEDREFWGELQWFHDHESFWQGKELSPYGVLRLIELRRRHDN